MKRILLAVVAALIVSASPARAEWNLSFPNETARKVATASSWATLFANYGLDAWDVLHCQNKKQCVVNALLRHGSEQLTVALVKNKVDRARPCAPDCGIENPMKSTPSGHTAGAFAAVDPDLPHFRLKLFLAVATAEGRVGGGKHWLSDAGFGAGIGLGVTKVW